MSKKNGRLSRQPIAVTCKTCGRQWLKRRDSVVAWLGECRSCTSKRTAQQPDVKAAQRANGLRVMSRGPLPNHWENRPRGAAHYNWKGGVTSEVTKFYRLSAMRAWRQAVLARDGFACRSCSATENLATDHIKPLALFPELRFDVDNGRTLCSSCHAKLGAKVRNGQLVRAAT